MPFNIVLFRNLREWEKTEAIERLIEDSTPRQEFYAMAALATSLAALGILLDNTPIIIGSMIVAPLLYPVLALGLSISLGDIRLLWRSVQTLWWATVLSLAVAAGVTAVFLQLSEYSRTAPVTAFAPTAGLMLVSILAAISAVLVMSKTYLNDFVSGVAIAMTLIPALAGVGIGLVTAKQGLVMEALTQYGLNIGVIVIISFILFSFMKFETKKRQVKNKVKQEDQKQQAEERQADQ